MLSALTVSWREQGPNKPSLVSGAVEKFYSRTEAFDTLITHVKLGRMGVCTKAPITKCYCRCHTPVVVAVHHPVPDSSVLPGVEEKS